MTNKKLVCSSSVLGRKFHADAFLVGEDPVVLAVLFGGSGKTAEEYESRARNVNPVLETAVRELSSLGSFILVFVTAPFDLAFAEIPDDPDIAERWNRHVRDELLPLIESKLPSSGGLPAYYVGYSGGALLALSGHQLDSRCVGVGFLGADGLSPSLRFQQDWGEITFAYNRGDGVFHANKEVIHLLARDNNVVVFNHLPGAHAFVDYVGNGSLRGLVMRAVNAGRSR